MFSYSCKTSGARNSSHLFSFGERYETREALLGTVRLSGRKVGLGLNKTFSSPVKLFSIFSSKFVAVSFYKYKIHSVLQNSNC